jgi:hypothetical protein
MYDALLWLTIYFMVILGAEHANSTHGYTDYYFTLHFAIALCFGVSTYIPFIYSYGILSCQQDITTGLYLPYLQAFALNHSRLSVYTHCSSNAPNTLQIYFIGGCQHARVTTRTILLMSTTCLKPAGLVSFLGGVAA